MKTLIRGGRVIDSARRDGRIEDIWIVDDRIAQPESDWQASHADRVVDATDCVVMAGGVDIHTHIGGGKLSIARMLLGDVIDDAARGTAKHAAESEFLPAAAVTAERYLQMGYTVGFEPAVIPCNARSAHSEMSDMSGLATGGYCLLGNEDLLLRLIADDVDQARINDYVAWMVRATQAIAVKVVNPGGISAFKFGRRAFDVDLPHPEYGVTPGQVVRCLARAVHEIGLVHPLHIHCSNLGVPGNIQSTLATIRAADGYPIHLTHAQFHCYGDEGPYRMSSAAGQLVDAMDTHRNVTIDVGQIMFGQTVTISADAGHQFLNRRYASPKKSVLVDIECEAGCGVVPFRYRRKQFVHSLQWAIGLELFLMIPDPSRVFLTTDHPNGAPFTAYPHLLRLLGDRSFRETALAEIQPDAAASSSLAGLGREYSLGDIETMTRSAAAEIVGLVDRGTLAPGAVADVSVYRENRQDLESMFRYPEHVLVRGRHVIDHQRGGNQVVVSELKAVEHQTLKADVDFDADSLPDLRSRYQQHSTFDMNALVIGDDELESVIRSRPVPQRTRSRVT